MYNQKNKKIITFALSCATIACIFAPKASAQNDTAQIKESPVKISGLSANKNDIYTDKPTYEIANRSSYIGEKIPIYIDGKISQSFDAHLINGVTYVPLRAFSDTFGDYEITWNGRNSTATVKKNGFYLSARVGTKYIVVNDRYFYTVNSIMNIKGRLYVPIRPMARAFALNLKWHADTRSVSLERTYERVKWASEVYREDDVYWLSRIINAESGGEPFDGKIAVGNVVLNRVKSKQYPDTIYGVIFDRRHGTQFSPVSFGTIYNDPNVSSVIAAKICLEGYSLTDRALFFLNPRIATNHWIEHNCTYEFTIGTHDFYS